MPGHQIEPLGGAVAAVVLAAGEGRRMAAPSRKQHLKLNRRPLFLYSLDFFLSLPDVTVVCLVLDPQALEAEPARMARALARKRAKTLVLARGGARRQDSALAGLRAAPPGVEIVLVHDSARPFPPLEPTLASIQAARECGGAILAAPAIDTIKMVEEQDLRIQQTLDRSRLWLAQTPQTFRYAELLHAMECAEAEGALLTDEAMAFERLHRPVRIIPSSPANLKITVPDDLRQAARILKDKGQRTKDERNG